MADDEMRGGRAAVLDSEQKIRQMISERNEINLSLNRRGRGGRFNPSSPGPHRFTSANLTPIGGGRGASADFRRRSEKVEGRGLFSDSVGAPKRSLLTAEEVTIEERPKAEEAKIDKATMSRGSRLMGGLMGHLKKAKSEDEASKANPLVQKKVAAEQNVEKRLQNFSDNLREARRLEAIARKNEDLTRMRELRIDIQVEERKLLRLKLEQHYEPMMNFLRTESDPSLFYKPAKSSKLIEEMNEDTKAKIRTKIDTLRGEFNEEALRTELRTRQLEWEADHPLREVEIRDKQEMLEARAAREAAKAAGEASTKEEEDKEVKDSDNMVTKEAEESPDLVQAEAGADKENC